MLLLLAKEGAKVAVTDIRDKDGQKVIDEIKAWGGVGGFWHLKVSNEKEVEKVFSEVEKEFRRIDVVVNTAGIADQPNTPTHELTEERWDKVMAVNVKGVFFCTKHVIPCMKKGGGGSIINILSISGIISGPGIPAYHASKGAVRLMSKTDALLYAGENIRVNSVHPGFMWTALVRDYLTTSGLTLEQGRNVPNEAHPLGHPGEPEDIAYGVFYLASEESKFITGERAGYRWRVYSKIGSAIE